MCSAVCPTNLRVCCCMSHYCTTVPTVPRNMHVHGNPCHSCTHIQQHVPLLCMHTAACPTNVLVCPTNLHVYCSGSHLTLIHRVDCLFLFILKCTFGYLTLYLQRMWKGTSWGVLIVTSGTSEFPTFWGAVSKNIKVILHSSCEINFWKC